MVAPSGRRQMAHRAVQEKGLSIRLACLIFSISETCYRYQVKCSDENTKIADWLLRLTQTYRNWGFGLCSFLLISANKLSSFEAKGTT